MWNPCENIAITWVFTTKCFKITLIHVLLHVFHIFCMWYTCEYIRFTCFYHRMFQNHTYTCAFTMYFTCESTYFVCRYTCESTYSICRYTCEYIGFTCFYHKMFQNLAYKCGFKCENLSEPHVQFSWFSHVTFTCEFFARAPPFR